MKRNINTRQSIEMQAEDPDAVLFAIAYLDWEFPSRKRHSTVKDDPETVVGVWALIVTAILSFTLILVQFLR